MKVSVRIRALLLALVMLLISSYGSLYAFADEYSSKQKLSVSVGIEALRAEFDSGNASEANGYALDYSYYSPVGENDTKKIPSCNFFARNRSR